MTNTTQHRSGGGLLKAGAWSAAAAALAMMALPSAAIAQERGGRSWSNGGNPAQVQSRGRDAARAWTGNRGGDNGRPAANRSAPSQRPDGNNPRAPNGAANGNAQRWAPGEVRNGPANRAAQAQRMRAEQAQRAQARQVERGSNDARNRPQWSNRERIDGNADRNRAYRPNDRREVERRDADRRDWRYTNDARRGNDNRWDNRRTNNNRWTSNSNRWNRDWRGDNRYDWHNYRNGNRNIYRAGRYYAPYRNYYYRPLGIGFMLNTGFYGNRYWINDPWYYRLPPAYGSYRWIRYFDDALLVDIYTGEVLDVINSFFW